MQREEESNSIFHWTPSEMLQTIAIPELHKDALMSFPGTQGSSDRFRYGQEFQPDLMGELFENLYPGTEREPVIKNS